MSDTNTLPTPGTIVTRKPSELRVHPLVAATPQLADDDDRFLAIARSIQEGGIRERLKITADNQIADGRHRWRSAKRLKLPEVECIVVSEDEVAQIALDTLVGRRHYNASQRAYAALPLLDAAFEAARLRRIKNLPDVANADDRNARVRFGDKRVEDLEQFCAHAGISLRLIQLARQVSKFFEDETERTITGEDGHPNVDVTFREYFEPRILREEDPIGLGAVLTGIKQILDLEKKAKAGKAHSGGKPKAPERQLALFTTTFTKDLANRYEYWTKFDDDQKEAAITQILPAIEQMPEDLLASLEKRLRAELKRREKAA